MQGCKWDTITKSVKALAEFCYNEDGITVGKPSVALKCGFGLRGLILASRSYALKFHDTVLEDNTRRMIALYEAEWTKITKHCHNAVKAKTEEKSELLPLTSDVKKLREYCQLQIQTISEHIKENGCNSNTWLMLAKAALTRLITFNARRGGEPGKLKIRTWMKIESKQNIHEEVVENLKNNAEKVLARRMLLGKILGKGKRPVPILFPPETVTAIRLLLKYRAVLGNVSNKFVFARAFRASTKHLRGSDCVREISYQSGLNSPELITATQMKKYICTALQLMDMTEAELRWVTDHLGHSPNVHKKWYRQTDNLVELTKVASVLVASETGLLQQSHTIQLHNLPAIAVASAGFDHMETITDSMEDDGTEDSDQSTPEHEEDHDMELPNRNESKRKPTCESIEENRRSAKYSKPLLRKDPDIRRNYCPSLVGGTSIIGSTVRKAVPKKQIHRAWTVEEKTAMYTAFGTYLQTRKNPPGKTEIEKMRAQHTALRERSWLNIKFQLKNVMQQMPQLV